MERYYYKFLVLFESTGVGRVYELSYTLIISYESSSLFMVNVVWVFTCYEQFCFEICMCNYHRWISI